MRRAVALLVIASIVFISCASSWAHRATELNGYKVVWQPNWYEGYKLCAIAYVPLPEVVLPDGTVTSGRHALKVFIDDARVYQRIETTSNIAGTTWMRHTVEWEIVANLPPALAATDDGWRDPDRKHKYVLREFDDMAGLFALDVFTDGSRNYWVTLTEYRPRAVDVHGMPPKEPHIIDTKAGQ